VRKEETSLVVTLWLLLLSNALACQVSDVVAVSGFLSSVGVNQILVVWLVDMLLTIVITGLQSLVVDRFNRVNLIGWMSCGYVLMLVGLRLLFSVQAPHWLSYSFLYLLAEQQLLFFPLVFWILANDLFDMVQTRRLFPLIATGSFVGQILGLGLAAIAPSLLSHFHLKPVELLSLNALIYLLAFCLIKTRLWHIKFRQTAQKPEAAIATLTEAWSFVREVPSFRYLMVAILAINVCLTVFEFRFLVVSSHIFGTADSYQRFYSLYRLGLTLTAFTVQGFFTHCLLKIMGLKNAFLALPLAQLTSALSMIIFPGAVGSIGGFSVSKLTQLTIDESARKSFQSLVPEERRGRVSMFMDSYLFAIGTIIGCLTTGLVVIAGSGSDLAYFYAYLLIALIACGMAISAILKMRTVYENSLFNWRLKRRQRGKNILDQLNL
jgi:AAA family ATP:ADP antiporter